MQLKRIISASLVDVIGGGTLAACVVGFIWLSLFHNNATDAHIKELKQWISAGQRDAVVLESAQNEKKALLASRQKELSTTGQVPLTAPIEEYFQRLARIAAELDLLVMRQHPLGSRWYPGLQEQRWAYEVKGSTAGLMRFLKAIESMEYWADVSYMRIDRGHGAEEAAVDQRTASLTISFFSAPLPQKHKEAEGT